MRHRENEGEEGEFRTVSEFLLAETPPSWLDCALINQSTLLIDHANCEKKAAGTAMSLLYRYIDKQDLLLKLSQLAREELLHFEQVVGLMQSAQVDYVHLAPGRYAASLHKHISTYEPDRLIDSLIIGAIVEARSCERFFRLGQRIDEPLAGFYNKLLNAEARHFRDYLELASLYHTNQCAVDMHARIDYFLNIETELILSSDSQFRFLSGVPTGVV